jgi:hypothetical protein
MNKTFSPHPVRFFFHPSSFRNPQKPKKKTLSHTSLAGYVEMSEANSGAIPRIHPVVRRFH